MKFSEFYWCFHSSCEFDIYFVVLPSEIVFGVIKDNSSSVLDFQKKIEGPAGPQVFIFCRQNKYSGRQKLYLRINGFSFLKDNGLSLVYVFPKKRVTYLGGQVSDKA